MNYLIRIADINISIHSINDIDNKNIKEYIIDDSVPPDIEVFSSNFMIEKEYQRQSKLDNDIASLSSIEALMIQRTIAEKLPDFDAFLLHGAAIAVHDSVYIFSAKSGTGKTTHIRHWLDRIDNMLVVNGDKPYILVNENGAFACGTPWCGKEDMGTNIILPLRSIVFMERSTENRMEKVSFKTILPKLLEQTYHPSGAAQMRKTLKLLLKLQDFVTFYIFHFDNYKEDVFRVSYDTLMEQ